MWTLILLSQLALIAAIDFRSLRIPNPLNILLALSGLAYLFFGQPGSAVAQLIAAPVVLLVAWVLQQAYELWRGRTGFGTGDVKLLGAMALWVKPMNLPALVLIASLSVLAAALGMYLIRRAGDQGSGMTLATRLPFGPFLALGCAVVWVLERL